MNSKFKILNKTYDIIEYYDWLLINYPKKERVIKENIERCLYDMIENLFAYNINDNDRIKQKYLKEYLIKLSMLDFYSKISLNKKLFSQKRFEVLGLKITIIRKMTYGLLRVNETVQN